MHLPVFGRDRVVRFMFGVLKKGPRWAEPVLADVNGEPGLVLRVGDGTFGVVTLGVANDLITEVFVVLNPEKLARVALGS